MEESRGEQDGLGSGYDRMEESPRGQDRRGPGYDRMEESQKESRQKRVWL